MDARKKILVVDDDPETRLLVRRVLEKTGYEVSEAGTGEDAVAHLAAMPVDLLIVDKHLPKMDGLAVASQARAKFPALPIVVITAVPEHAFRVPAGVDLYLSKPFKSLEALQKGVAEAFELRRTALQRQETLEKLAKLSAQLRPTQR